MATDQHDTVIQPIAINDGGATMRDLAISSIATSLTNPRKTFDQVKLQDLANSIASMGVNMPIIVRPLPASRLQDTHEAAKGKGRQAALPEYELVAGERRWRASQLAGKSSIPAIIRQLTDAQALEVQIIENLQREDVSELEEAEGYEYLMSANQINAEAVAEKIGKSRSYVFGRLKLLNLCEQGRDALREGKIDHSVALPIARIPSEQLQQKALQYATQTNYYGSTPGAREVTAHVRNHYMLKLKEAPFDRKDAELCPKAGACTDCSKRTGASPDLFTDVDSADVCTDPPCFHNKEELHAARVRQAAEDQGLDVIDGREAKALMPSAYSGEVSGYLRLDSDKDIPIKGKPLRKIIARVMEQSGIKPTMIVNPHDPKQLIAVLRPEQAQELLQAAGAKEHQDKLQEQTEREEKEAKREQASKDQQAYEVKWRKDLAKDLVHKVALQAVSWEAMPRTLYETLCKQQITALDADSIRQLCDVLELGKIAPQEALTDWAKNHDYPDVALMQLMVWKDRMHRTWTRDSGNEVLMCIAAECGVDVTAFQAQMKANLRAAKATKKQLEAKKAAQRTQSPDSLKPRDTASTPTPAAQAQKVRGGKKKIQVDEKPKLSAAAAQAAIAEALQAAEPRNPADAAEARDAGQGDIPGAAAAAQDDDVQAVAVAQPATVTASEEAAPASTIELPADTPAAGGERPQDETPALTVANGDIVRVKEGLKGPNGKFRKTCGRVGIVTSHSESQVQVKFGPKAHEYAIFDHDDLEAYTALPLVGERVRVLRAGLLESRNKFMWQHGSVMACEANGWRIRFHNKKGGLPTEMHFDTDELEAL